MDKQPQWHCGQDLMECTPGNLRDISTAFPFTEVRIIVPTDSQGSPSHRMIREITSHKDTLTL